MQWQRLVTEGLSLIAKIFAFIWNAIVLVWDVTVGLIARMWAIPFESLSLPKQILFVVVILAAIVLLIVIVLAIFRAISHVAALVVDFVTAIAAQWKLVVLLAIVAFGGAWAVTNLQF
jgi:hypothetical protein